MDSLSSNSAGFILNAWKSRLSFDKFEQKVEGMCQNWEDLIQDQTNNANLEFHLNTIPQFKFSFDNHYMKRRQCLTNYEFQMDEELDENTKSLEKLQKQKFASNMTNQLAIIQQTNKLKLIRIIRTNIEQAEIKLNTIYDKLIQKYFETIDQLLNLQQQQYEVRSQGLSQEIIQTFNLFTADESHVGDQCSICMEDIEVGRIMRRLTCDGQHYFCKQCVEGWFAEHKTCPLCRHKFG